MAQFDFADPALVAEVASRLTPQPLRTFTEPVRAAQADVIGFSGGCLPARDRDPQPYERFVPLAELVGWHVTHVAGGHILMSTNTLSVVDFLLRSAGLPSRS